MARGRDQIGNFAGHRFMDQGQAGQGRNHGWKDEGDQGFGPNTGALVLSVGCGRGSPLPAVGVRGYHPLKIFKDSDAKSCILATTCCEISCFLKTTAKKLGDQYIVIQSWGGSLPRSLRLLRLWGRDNSFRRRHTYVRR